MKKIIIFSLCVVVSLIFVIITPTALWGFNLALTLVNLIEEVLDKVVGVA